MNKKDIVLGTSHILFYIHNKCLNWGITLSLFLKCRKCGSKIISNPQLISE